MVQTVVNVGDVEEGIEEVEAKLGVAKGKQQRKPQQQRQRKIKEKVDVSSTAPTLVQGNLNSSDDRLYRGVRNFTKANY